MTTQRADAVRNREKLLDAALDTFAEAGTNASLEAIAKRAGVGIGTLYRHFPTRDALVEAAYRSEVDHLCAAADELLAEHPPDAALAEWTERWIGYTATKRGMADALNAVVAGGSAVRAETRTQIVAAIERMLQAGIAAGTLRADLTADDVMRALGAVWQVTDPEQARRLLRLLMDGLRANTRLAG
jgi:AcrR family transcriptional regulator